MSSTRIAYLDVIRIFACLLIITMHSPMPNNGADANMLSAISMITAPGIGLFFMVSGALLLPTQEPTGTFLKRRLKKVVYPTLFWSLFYLSLTFLTKGMTEEVMLKKICSIPFSTQGHSIMWFMYTLTGLYLLAPILSPWLRQASRRELEWVLALWGVTLCFPLLTYLVKVNTSNTGMLYYFSGYAGYFLLGYYLKTYRPKLKGWQIALLFIIPITTAIVLKITHTPINFYTIFWYQSILIVMMCVGWFCIFQKNEKSIPHRSWISVLSNCCFGIYLIHIFIMRSILWKCDFISAYGSIMQIVMTVILTGILSFAIVWCMSKLPFAQYIIGFKQKK